MNLPVSIAGVRFDLDLAQGAAGSARERYRAFANGKGSPRFHIEANVAAAPSTLAPLTGRCVRSGSGLVVAGAEALGALDLVSGHGHLEDHPSLSGLDVLIRAALTLEVLSRGGFLCHAAAVVVDGQAHLFPGRSGAGKSTLAGLSRDALCDELCAILPRGEHWDVHGTPFWTGRAGSAPLCAVYRLLQAPDKVSELDRIDGARHLLTNLALFVDEPSLRIAAFLAAGRAAASVPFRELAFTPNSDVDALLHRVRGVA